MQDHGAVGRAAHARVGDAHHVLDALLEKPRGDGGGAPLGHAGRAAGAGVLEHEDGGFVDRQGRIVDAAVEVVVVAEDHGAAPVGQEVRGGGRLFEHGAVGAEVAGEDDGAAFGGERHLEGADDILIPAPGVADGVGERPAVNREGVAVEEGQELAQDGGEAAGVEEVFHEVLARGLEVDEEGGGAREGVKARERERHLGAAGEGDQVDDGVGGAPDGHVAADRVVEGLCGEEVGGPGAAGPIVDAVPITMQ